jgi:hypothetical protein
MEQITNDEATDWRGPTLVALTLLWGGNGCGLTPFAFLALAKSGNNEFP